MRSIIVCCVAALALAGCGGANDTTGPGGVSASDAEMLNGAAAVLDNDSISANAVMPEPENQR